jgi:hypothetical protein
VSGVLRRRQVPKASRSAAITLAGAIAALQCLVVVGATSASAGSPTVIIDDFASGSSANGPLGTRTVTSTETCGQDSGGQHNAFSAGGGTAKVVVTSCAQGSSSNEIVTYSGGTTDLTSGDVNDELAVTVQSVGNSDNTQTYGNDISVTITDTSGRSSTASQSPGVGFTGDAAFFFGPGTSTSFSGSADPTEIKQISLDFSPETEGSGSSVDLTDVLTGISAKNSTGATSPVLDHLVITPTSSSVTAGVALGFTVTAVSAHGALVTDNNDDIGLSTSVPHR